VSRFSSFESFDGVPIAYYAWGAEQATFPPVVLHHGFVVNAQLNWVLPGVVEALVAAGRRVYALDARGHGESGKPYDPASYGEGAMSRDLSLLFDVIGAADVHLVGYSMGGIVALLTAARDRRVRRLVVGGIGAGVVEIGGVDTRALGRGAVAAALLAEDPSTITDPRAAAFRRLADRAGGDLRALAAQAAAPRRAGLPLADISAPTLVLAGADDRLASRPQVLADALADGRAVVIPGDHVTAVTEPGFAAAIVGFLAGSG
jgi:pimeloyl-ACP methyl ester carboxylesterase